VGIVTGDDAPLFYEPCQGENERVAPMRVVKVPLKKSLSISKKLFVVARRFVFLDHFSVVARHKETEGYYLTHWCVSKPQ
jgi:hypothetical protein